jgi:hypothetical protein
MYMCVHPALLCCHTRSAVSTGHTCRRLLSAALASARRGCCIMMAQRSLPEQTCGSRCSESAWHHGMAMPCHGIMASWHGNAMAWHGMTASATVASD